MRAARALRLAVGVLGLLAISSVSSPVAAQERASGGRVPTVTRLVKLFLDKEGALGASVRSADAAALGKLLTDDFELRTGARAANPVPRGDWMREMLRTRDPGGDISRMAVHDFGGTAIASFVQDSLAGPLFVVDVWRADGSDWKLAVRYAGPAATGFPVPGAAAGEPEIPKKY